MDVAPSQRDGLAASSSYRTRPKFFLDATAAMAGDEKCHNAPINERKSMRYVRGPFSFVLLLCIFVVFVILSLSLYLSFFVYLSPVAFLTAVFQSLSILVRFYQRRIFRLNTKTNNTYPRRGGCIIMSSANWFQEVGNFG